MGEDRCLNETRRTVLAPLLSFVALTASPHVACFDKHSPSFLDDHRSPPWLRRLPAIPPQQMDAICGGSRRTQRDAEERNKAFLIFRGVPPFSLFLALMALVMQVRNHRWEGHTVSTHNLSAPSSRANQYAQQRRSQRILLSVFRRCFRDEARRRAFFGTHFHDDRQRPRRSDTIAGIRNRRPKTEAEEPHDQRRDRVRCG